MHHSLFFCSIFFIYFFICFSYIFFAFLDFRLIQPLKTYKQSKIYILINNMLYKAQTYCDILKFSTFFKTRKWLFDVCQFAAPVTSHFRNKQSSNMTNISPTYLNSWWWGFRWESFYKIIAINYSINSRGCPRKNWRRNIGKIMCFLFKFIRASCQYWF